MEEQKKFIVAIIIILLLLVLAIAGYYTYKNYNQIALLFQGKDSHGCSISGKSSWCQARGICINSGEECETFNWKVYKNDTLSYQFKYPVEWVVGYELEKSLASVWESDAKKVEAESGPTIPINSEFTVKYWDKDSFIQSAKNNTGNDINSIEDFMKLKFPSYSKTTVDGKDAYAGISVANGAVYDVYVPYDGGLYVLAAPVNEAPDQPFDPAKPNINQNIKNIISTFKFTNSQTVVGGDKDEHGCLGSAGYSWCGRKEKCIRPWEEPCNVAIKEINIAAPVAISNINLDTKQIDATVAIGFNKTNKKVRVVVSDSTKFISTCDGGNSFDSFYDLNKNWVGPNWWFIVKGPESDDGSIIFANEISCTAQ